MDGRRLLTGGFARDTRYPDFAILLDRRRFDHILLRNAIDAGAEFEGNHSVREIDVGHDEVRVCSPTLEGSREEYQGRIVIGADGVSSAVSRQLGNTFKDGVMAVSLRAYFDGVKQDGSQIKVYFDRGFFPGYGWMFVDDDGFANVGLGYAYDKKFPLRANLRKTFHAFIERDLGDDARGLEPVRADLRWRRRVLPPKRDRRRPGDAGRRRRQPGGSAQRRRHPQGDGGRLARRRGGAVTRSRSGTSRRPTLGVYEQLWQENLETDWKTAEFFLSVAKNPALRDFCLYLLTQIGLLTTEDPRFQEFASGVFSGTDLPERGAVAARALPGVPKAPGDVDGPAPER